MIRAYYTATNGAISNENYLDVMSNNMANIQTDGYKKSNAEFSDLLYTNIQGASGEAQAGSGSKIAKVDTVFNQGDLYATGNDTDYAIKGDGFFAVKFNDNTYFTRAGNFKVTNVDGQNYLMYQGGYVLDDKEEPIKIENKVDAINVGVFQMGNNSNLQKSGNNLFKLTNGDVYNLSENSKSLKGYLEASGVEVSEEMVKLLQVQRSFQLNSKVIQTADEIEQTINSLRN